MEETLTFATPRLDRSIAVPVYVSEGSDKDIL